MLGHTAGVGDPPDAFFERLGSRGAATPRRRNPLVRWLVSALLAPDRGVV
jgi:hypothetical protein